MPQHGFYCTDCELVFTISSRKSKKTVPGSATIVVSRGHTSGGYKLLTFEDNEVIREIGAECPECGTEEDLVRAAKNNLLQFIKPE